MSNKLQRIGNLNRFYDAVCKTYPRLERQLHPDLQKACYQASVDFNRKEGVMAEIFDRGSWRIWDEFLDKCDELAKSGGHLQKQKSHQLRLGKKALRKAIDKMLENGANRDLIVTVLDEHIVEKTMKI